VNSPGPDPRAYFALTWDWLRRASFAGEQFAPETFEDRLRREARRRREAVPPMLLWAGLAGSQSPFTPGSGGGGGGGGPALDGGFYATGATGAGDCFRNQILDPFWTPEVGEWSETDSLRAATTFPAVLRFNRHNYANTTAEVTLTAAADGSCGVVVRGSLAGGLLSGYVAIAEATRIGLYRYDAGVATLLGSTAGGLVAGETFGVRVTSTTVRTRKNGINGTGFADATYANGFTGPVAFTSSAVFSCWTHTGSAV